MKKLALAILLAFSCPALFAQMMTVSASNIVDSRGKGVNGTITFKPVTSGGQPLSFRMPNGGQAITKPVTVNLRDGVFTVDLPNVSLTNPQNACFAASVQSVSGFGLGPGYNCIQPSPAASWCTATACNFDNFIPNFPALSLVSPFVSTIFGNAAAAGAITFAGPGVTQTGNTFTFGAQGSWPGFPTAGIVVTDGAQWLPSLAAPTGALVGTTDTQALTNKTVDGVSPATFGFLDATSSIQTQLNSKLGSAVVSINGTSGAFTFNGTGVNCVTGTCTFNGGGITSIAWTVPSFMTASPATLAASGTETFSFNSQAANTFLAAANGAPSVPSFRTIVAADIPTLNQNTTGTAANVTAISNSTLATLSALVLPYSQLSGTPAIPTSSSWPNAGACASNNFVTALVNGAIPTCAQVQYSQLGGSVPTWNQSTTGTAAGLSGASPTAVGIKPVAGSACLHIDSTGIISNTGSDCGTGGGGGATLQTNGVNNSSQILLNFTNPASFNGLSFAFSNPSGGNETFGVSGTLNNAGLANAATTVNGQTCTLGSTCTVSANNPNALTVNNSGTGATSGSTYDGSAPITISYNTIGAAPNPVPLTDVATQAADTIDMNASGIVAAPTAVTMPACAAAGHANVYDPVSHTWSCNAIATNNSVTAHQFLNAYNSTTGAFAKAQPACADLSDAASGCSTAAFTLPTASTTVLGGVKVDGSTITIASGVISAASSGGTVVDGVGTTSGGQLAESTTTAHTIQYVTANGAAIGLGSVTNDAQTKAAIVPNTAPTAGQILVGNVGATAYAPVSLGGDCTLASTGVETCTKTNGTAFVASATTDTTNATNIASGTLNHARLPALVSGDIPNNAANTTGNAATVTTAASTTAATYSILAVPSTSGSQAGATVAGFSINPSTGAVNLPGPVSTSGTTHGITIPAGTAVAGSVGNVVYTSDATSGFAEVNENNTGLSRVCTAANGICAGSGTVSDGAGSTTVNQLAVASAVAHVQSYVTTLPTAAEPAHTGDATNSAGSLAMTVVKVNGAVIPTSAAFTATNGSNQIIAAAFTPTNAAVVPSTAPSAGQLLIGNAGATAYAPIAMSNDCTIASTGAITCTKSSGTAFGTAAFQNTGTSGGTLGFLNGVNTYSGADTFSGAGAASTPGVTISGAPFATGTATTNFPQLYLNAGVAPTTFSATGTELGINSPSGFTGNFLDFHVNGGVSVAKLDAGGNLTVAGCTGCTAGGGGNVSNTGTPTNGQIAQWTSATVIQGITSVPIANGGTNAATAATALSNLLGNPVAGTYQLICASGTSCTTTTGGTSAFSALTSSTNSSAAMVVGTGASLAVSGSGTIAATSLSAVSALPNGTTATTQSAADNSTKVATTAYVDTKAVTSQCEVAWGGTGTSNALQTGDDSIVKSSCFNKTGKTWTISGVYCMTDVASNTTTINPTFGTAGSGTSILSGALTCGSSFAWSATGTLSGSPTIADGNSISPVMGGTLTGTSVHMLITYTRSI